MSANPHVSIIIVTYNSAHTITFCLDSILNSEGSDKLEIVVVDNNSDDYIESLISDRYPDVQLIINDENLGFAKACNIGARSASGDILFFVNPDCIISENAILEMVGVLDDQGAGMVGPLLLDGSGQILPETARELPTIKSAFFKIIGHPLGIGKDYYRPVSDSNFETPVLSGAAMMIRIEEFRRIGGFDERYFMYGEDIDLSFQSIQNGNRNVVAREAKVIHFKGESTDKWSPSYHRHFFKSMGIFLNKHSEFYNYRRSSGLVSIIINIAIVLNLTGTWIKRLTGTIIDGVLIVAVFFLVQYVWSYIKSGNWLYFENTRYLVQYLSYTLIILIFLFYSGVYHANGLRIRKLFKGVIYGGLAILILYAMLPIEFRFSRMIIILSIIVILMTLIGRYRLMNRGRNSRVLLISGHSKLENFKNILNYKNAELVRGTSEVQYSDEVKEIVFDTSSVRILDAIHYMEQSGPGITYTFWNPGNTEFFSSADSKVRGKMQGPYAHYHLNQDIYKIQKRTFDLIAGLILFLPSVILTLIKRNLSLVNWKELMAGKMTIVGYERYDNDLPELPPGLLSCYSGSEQANSKKTKAHDYAAHYSILDDVFISLSKFNQLVSILSE